jgi:hypothetical protein
MTDHMYFDMPCPRCQQILKVGVVYTNQSPYPFKAGDLGGHHANCPCPTGLHSLGISPVQAMETLHLLMLPTC